MLVPEFEHPLGVLGALGAGHALHDDLAGLGQEDRHVCPTSLRCELGGAVGCSVHRVDHRHQRVVGLVEDPPALVDVVAVEADDERLVGLVAEDLQRVHDAVGDGVARGDPAEDVDEDALHLRVAQDDVQAVGHHLGRGAAADVEEVGGLHAAVALAGIRDDVERRHDEPGAVADDADLAVELDVVEALLLGRRLERVGRGLVLERRVVGVPEVGVLVERHLAVERLEVAVAEQDERVDLDERGVLLDEHRPELLDHLDGLVGDLGREAGRLDDLAGLGVVDADERVDADLGDRVGVLVRDDLDLDAALGAGDAEVLPGGAVDEVGEVVLLGDVGGRRDQHPVHGVALDVHAEDVAGLGRRPRRGLRRA